MAAKNPLSGKIILNNIITEWFYMNKNQITPQVLASSLKEFSGVKTECWFDAGIIVVTKDGGSSIDFELSDPVFDDPFDNHFLKSHNIRTLYNVTFSNEAYETAMTLFKYVTKKHEGMFCADTDDFLPFIT